MPMFEHLKKQAKTYLRWHREGYYPVAAQIRHFLPRFQNMPDADILAASFRLADAQELIARKNGFDHWAALKAGLEIMTDSERHSSGTARLRVAEPQLFVTDIDRAHAFYESLLGFALVFSYGEPVFYAQIGRDGVHLNLRRVDRPLLDGVLVRQEDLLSATLLVDDAKALFLEYKARDVPFHQTLRAEPWGARTFIVEDPDGNLLAFADGSGA